MDVELLPDELETAVEPVVVKRNESLLAGNGVVDAERLWIDRRADDANARPPRHLRDDQRVKQVVEGRARLGDDRDDVAVVERRQFQRGAGASVDRVDERKAVDLGRNLPTVQQ